MRIDQIALNAVSVKADSLEATVSAASSAGFTRIEFNLRVLKDWLAAGRATAELSRLFAGHRLRFVGGFEVQVQSFAEPAQQADNQALLVANAELIAELGGGIMVVGSDGPADGGTDGLAVVGRRLREIAKRFPAGVSMALEFNWSPYVRSLKAAAQVVTAADHPQVGILFDPAHYHCTPSKLEHLTPDVVQQIKHVHVNDMRDKPGELSQCNADRVLPGEGCLDLPELLGRIERYGYTGAFSIELFNDELWQLPAPEAARRMYQSMVKLCEAIPV